MAVHAVKAAVYLDISARSVYVSHAIGTSGLRTRPYPSHSGPRATPAHSPKPLRKLSSLTHLPDPGRVGVHSTMRCNT
jgi:hypothetical protein